MDYVYPPEAEELRAELRAWLDEHWPLPDEDFDEATSAEVGVSRWHKELHSGGWVGIDWPAEYGGRSATVAQKVVYGEELRRAGAPGPGNVIGLGWAGPTIIRFGTDAQKERFLPGILSGDDIWCQLFSEPNAGSDLASVQTRAERTEGGWLISGQKVWNSGAHIADWAILIARTDPDLPKHKGLTYFLCEMKRPEITVRPLRQMTGTAEFNEVFFDEVFIPDDLVVGEVNGGWAVTVSTLASERSGLSGGRGALWGGGHDMTDLLEMARGLSPGGMRPADNPVMRQRLAKLYCEAEALRFTKMRTLSSALLGRAPGPEISILKLFADQFGQRIYKTAVDLLGPAGVLMENPEGESTGWRLGFLFSPALTIGGGTSEVMRNVIGERVLGLPKEPKPA